MLFTFTADWTHSLLMFHLISWCLRPDWLVRLKCSETTFHWQKWRAVGVFYFLWACGTRHTHTHTYCCTYPYWMWYLLLQFFIQKGYFSPLLSVGNLARIFVDCMFLSRPHQQNPYRCFVQLGPKQCAVVIVIVYRSRGSELFMNHQKQNSQTVNSTVAQGG